MRGFGGGRLIALGLILMALGGCGVGEAPPPTLVVATTWPPSVQAQAEHLYHQQAGARAIHWITLRAPAWLAAAQRRGGVDLVVGGSPRDLLPLLDAGQLAPLGPGDSVPWRVVERPVGPGDRREAPSALAHWPSLGEPRDDPARGDDERQVLAGAGWQRGWATLVGHLDLPPVASGRPSIPPPHLEVLAQVRTGQHPDQAARFASALAAATWSRPAPPGALGDARADDLRADLLESALWAARPERRDALEALERAGHPPQASSALGQLPPWPPASVARLLAEPSHGPLVEALLSQVTPDFAARDWLRASWTGPRGVVDPALLASITRAADGRLAREPRFRAWLRAEWTASMQQHYRRVARLAGGYRPS